MRLAAATALTVFALAASPTSAAPCPPDTLCAGAGKVDMTPPVGTPMGGFFARSAASGPQDWAEQLTGRGPEPNLYAKTFRQSEGIHTPMHVRALVVQAADGERYAFASIENRGAPYELHQAVVARLDEAGAGIPKDHLVFSSTHSHAAPSPLHPWTAYGIISADLFDPRVFEIATDAMVEAILKGVTNLEPARIGVGQATLVGASRNRRMEQFVANPEIDAENPPGPGDPAAIDPEVTVLRAESTDQRPIGAFFAFAVHGTTLGDDNPLFSGDNMGPAMRFCEAALGGRVVDDVAPAPICPQANGAEGDISPTADTTDVWATSGYARAEQTGRQVASAVLEAWDDAVPSDATTLDARFEILYFRGQEGDPGEPTSPLPFVGVGGNFGDGVGLPLDLPFQGDKLIIPAGPGGYPQWVPLQVIRVGDTGFLSLPVEMTVQMSRRIRAATLDASKGLFERTVVLGLANAYASYTATEEEYATNQYEGAWTLYGPQEGNLFRNELVKLVGDMVAGRPTESLPALPLGEAIGLEPTSPLLPDDADAVGTIVTAPSNARRGEVVSMTWVGGNPAVDRPRGTTLVHLERNGGDGWSALATEDDTFSIVRIDRDGPQGPHRWTARFDLPLDVAAGSYRIRVTGRYATVGGETAPYAITAPFVVEESHGIVPGVSLDAFDASAAEATVVVSGTWPEPAGERYATRPRTVAAGTARLEVVRDGTVVSEHEVSLNEPEIIPAESGDEIVVPPLALEDAHDNRNGTATTVTIP